MSDDRAGEPLPLGGRITRDAIATRLAARTAPLERVLPRPASTPVVATARVATPAPAIVREPGDVDVAMSPLRKRIAANLTHSLATAAHTLVVTEVDYSAVERVRADAQLTYLPFVARAAIDALKMYPHVNATLHDDVLVVHEHINLGISVDLDFEGLVVPVVRAAELLRLRSLADALRERAAAARARRLGVDDLHGGTFTITNAGGYGTVVTGPIINAPQVAILSTDSVRMRPSAIADGAGNYSVGVRPLGNLSLSFDHRAFDGAYAAAFLALVRDILVERDWKDEL